MAMELNISQKNKQVATAIALAGRSCRPCDVCGRDQARWFCSADEAYLCGKCDDTVHGANAVASRHERSPLGPGGLPCSTKPSSMSVATNYSKLSQAQKRNAADFSVSTTLGAPRKKPRSVRPHPHAASIGMSHGLVVSSEKRAGGKDQTVDMALSVKNEPLSPYRQAMLPCEELSAATVDFFQSEAAHEVPIFAPSSHDLLISSDYNCSFTLDCTLSSHGDAKVVSQLPQERDSHFDLNCFLSSKANLRAMKEEMDAAMDEFTVMDELGLFTICGEHLTNEEYGLDFTSMASITESTEGSEGEAGDACEVADESLNDLCWKVKEEKDDLNETEKLKLEVDELLACALVNVHKEEEEDEKAAEGRKFSLKLDYEDVLVAWSDRGPLWIDGRGPLVVPEECEYDSARCSLGIGIVPDINYCDGAAVPLEQVGLVPVANVCEDNGGREARVMRYREKRRTRLFSKKIRYEVRKLNAEMRPRWKGRFVKRSIGVS